MPTTRTTDCLSSVTPSLLYGELSAGHRADKDTTATSTIEVEYMAIAEAAKEAVWWRSFLGELGHDVSQPTPLLNHSQGSIHLAKER